MGIGIGSSWKDDDDYDGPMFGRHWLEDIEDEKIISNKPITKEEVFHAYHNLSFKDKEWIKRKLNMKERILTKLKSEILKKNKK